MFIVWKIYVLTSKSKLEHKPSRFANDFCIFRSNGRWIADFSSLSIFMSEIMHEFPWQIDFFYSFLPKWVKEFHIPTECSVDKVLRKRYFCRVIVFQKVLIEHEFQNFLHNFWLFRTHWLRIWWCQVSILLEY